MQLSPHMRTKPGAPGRVSKPAAQLRSVAGKKPHVGVNRAYGKGRRYYSPTLARWLSRDPMAEVGFQYAFAQGASLVDRPLPDMSISYTGLNVRPVFGVIDQSGGASPLYLFVANDGVNSWDYLGLYKRVFRCVRFMTWRQPLRLFTVTLPFGSRRTVRCPTPLTVTHCHWTCILVRESATPPPPAPVPAPIGVRIERRIVDFTSVTYICKMGPFAVIERNGSFTGPADQVVKK